MSKEIIINVTGEHSRIAIVEDGELVELYIENPENARTIGDIYLAKVRRILPGIKAAFVDIGQKQDAFLHFSDLSDNLPALLELSEGTVPDWSTKSLPTAPKQDGEASDDLELETPEEQRAARRRRDLKRTHGRSRRGRGRGQETEEKPASEDTAAEPSSAETSEEASEPRSRGRSGNRNDDRSGSRSDGAAKRGGRGRPSAPPEGTPRSEGTPGDVPQIIPPDAVAEPPSRDESTDAPDAEASSTDAPKRERGRRGGRGRGRGRGRSGQSADQQTRSERAGSELTSDSAEASAPPTDEKNTPQEQRGEEQRTSRGRSGRGRSGRSRRQADPAEARSEPEAPKSKAPKKDERSDTRSSGAGSSRFVIDLTSKPNRAKRVEEEEEEEERSSRGRRGGRRRGRGRGRGRSGASRSETAENSESSASGDGQQAGDAADQDSASNGDGSSNRRGSSRRRSSSRSSSSRSASGNGRSSGRGDSGRGRSSRSGSSKGGSGGSSNGSSERPEKYLKQDQRIVVKVTKEPISSKGPRVSTDVSLAGRFLVLIPQADYVAVSKKIESSKERRRLRALARSLLPESFGLIVRTVAENREAKALDTDLRLLLERWKKIEDQIKQKPKPPKLLHEDVNMVSSIIRDLFSEDYDRIVVDDPTVHKHVKTYVEGVAPQMAPKVKLHTSKEHVFRTYKIDGEVRAAFESRVSLPGGGYLFIEHTEAMHVVDVNSGRAGRGLSQEQNALRVNLEAARAITKQLRLRDLGGIICVDFIDMRSESARRKLTDELKREFRKDRAVTKLLPMSDFGVVQITRQRLRPSITTTTDVDDLPEPLPEPEAGGPDSQEQTLEYAPEPATERESQPDGEAQTAAEVVADLERWLATYRAEVQEQHRKRPILVRVHPFLAAYLQRGVPSALTRWRFRTRLKFRLDVDDSANPLAFSVRDEKSGKNLTKKYSRAAGDA